jgi:hypothetical protein
MFMGGGEKKEKRKTKNEEGWKAQGKEGLQAQGARRMEKSIDGAKSLKKQKDSLG